jgi:hypothetical protein
MAVAIVIAMETLLAEDVEEVGAVVAEEETIVSIYRMSNALILARKVLNKFQHATPKQPQDTP